MRRFKQVLNPIQNMEVVTRQHTMMMTSTKMAKSSKDEERGMAGKVNGSGMIHGMTTTRMMMPIIGKQISGKRVGYEMTRIIGVEIHPGETGTREEAERQTGISKEVATVTGIREEVAIRIGIIERAVTLIGIQKEIGLETGTTGEVVTRTGITDEVAMMTGTEEVRMMTKKEALAARFGIRGKVVIVRTLGATENNGKAKAYGTRGKIGDPSIRKIEMKVKMAEGIGMMTRACGVLRIVTWSEVGRKVSRAGGRTPMIIGIKNVGKSRAIGKMQSLGTRSNGIQSNIGLTKGIPQEREVGIDTLRDMRMTTREILGGRIDPHCGGVTKMILVPGSSATRGGELKRAHAHLLTSLVRGVKAKESTHEEKVSGVSM